MERTTTWEGYVGLIYPSDYGYAVGGEARTNCLANTNLDDYGTNNCYTNDWLYNKTSTDQWTMSQYASSSDACFGFLVSSVGLVSLNSDSFGFVVRPALFLKSNVGISGGEGSSTNPYVLSLE